MVASLSVGSVLKISNKVLPPSPRPAVLLAEYQQSQAAVAEMRTRLRRELETALTR